MPWPLWRYASLLLALVIVQTLHPYCNKHQDITMFECQSADNFETLLETASTKQLPALLFFCAPYCVYSRKLAKPLDELASEAQAKGIFIKIDVSQPQHESLTNRFNVTTLPSISFMRNGEVIRQYVGSDVTKIKEMVRDHLTNDGATGNGPTPEKTSSNPSANPNSPSATPRGVARPVKVPTLPSPREGKAVLNVAHYPGNIIVPYTPDAGSHYLPAARVAEDLQRSILTLYGQFLSDDGCEANYLGMARSPAFLEYVRKTSALQAVNLRSLSVVELRCFFLNLFNALCIHAKCVMGPPEASLKGKIEDFFRCNCYCIGGDIYSLDDILHGILRGNQSHPLTARRLFSPGDARIEFALPLDPRVHCALSCGAKSSPPLRMFTPQTLDQALTQATRAFCESETEVRLPSREVVTSKLFLWYGKDLGATDSQRLRWLTDYCSEEKRELLLSMLEEGEVSLKFKEFDWSSNARRSEPRSE